MVEEKPTISVIMPSLNVRDYIEQCVESVLNQTLENIEIICIDAGSDDGTLEILKKYTQEDSRINVYLSPKKSYGSQINQGIQIAKGKYVAIVETDDYIRKDMFEYLYGLTQLDYIDIVKGNFFHVYGNGDETQIRIDTAKSQVLNEKAFILERQPLFLEGHPSIWAAIYKRSFLINQNIRFLEEKGGAWVDNPFFYESAIKAATITYTNKAFYYYRESNENSSSNNLKDLSIPIKRVNDMFKVINDCEYQQEAVNELLYKRLFRYLEIIEENNNGTDFDYETTSEINKALSNMNMDYVRKNLSIKQKKFFYKYRSPLVFAQFN